MNKIVATGSIIFHEDGSYTIKKPWADRDRFKEVKISFHVFGEQDALSCNAVPTSITKSDGFIGEDEREDLHAELDNPPGLNSLVYLQDQVRAQTITELADKWSGKYLRDTWMEYEDAAHNGDEGAITQAYMFKKAYQQKMWGGKFSSRVEHLLNGLSEPTQSSTNCTCDFNLILAQGCKCGST